ncbi:metallo-beta-lactamase domain-containing protein 1 [Bacillus rossius redtenbacheri]|uniref:metallo-beta-lactamase domain-containing protein 1 n=1 Tax=Bacillus rossius redtenbacheri TaxID=93214 RepID=UPI002FDE2EE6
MSAYRIHVLFEGYSTLQEHVQIANCTCTLITGQKNVIVDTMTPWDGARIFEALRVRSLKCEDIDYVVSTHGHADHVGNNNLFLNATHIVGTCIFKCDKFYNYDFDGGNPYPLDGGSVCVFATPGHTLDHVSVLVRTEDLGVVVVAGDLFEKEEDVFNPEIWKASGSADQCLQVQHRNKVLLESDYIIPGHGPMFKVTEGMRDTVKN